MKGDFVMGKLREQMKIDLELQSSKQVLEYLGRYSNRGRYLIIAWLKWKTGRLLCQNPTLWAAQQPQSKKQAQVMSEDFGEYLNHQIYI